MHNLAADFRIILSSKTSLKVTISDFSSVLRTYEAEIILMHLNNHLRPNWPWPELILKELLRHLKKPDLSMVKNLRND